MKTTRWKAKSSTESLFTLALISPYACQYACKNRADSDQSASLEAD